MWVRWEEIATSSDGVLVSSLLVHEAFLAVHRHDLPFDRLTIYSVAADGVETVSKAVSLQTGMKFAPGWSAADGAVESSFGDGEKVRQALSGLTNPVNSGAEWVAGGRRAAPPGQPRRIRHCCPQSGYLPGCSFLARVAPRPHPL